ncbi:hypothetical protein BDZ97DRAFT_1774600 [Flammula alnicola]|nr:hypothetical protein BDZ97DRAFT_1774600 [Flammula alnicola]
MRPFSPTRRRLNSLLLYHILHYSLFYFWLSMTCIVILRFNGPCIPVFYVTILPLTQPFSGYLMGINYLPQTVQTFQLFKNHIMSTLVRCRQNNHSSTRGAKRSSGILQTSKRMTALDKVNGPFGDRIYHSLNMYFRKSGLRIIILFP